MNSVMPLILAGGQGDRLSILSEQRAKPAVPFGGQYRIIDFALSNCAASELSQVSVLTQYRPRSLVSHIGSGQAWGLNTLDGAVQTLQPYLGRSDMDWYQGTADAVYQNLYVIAESNAREVLILSADHIYLTSYRNLIAYHRTQAADATIAVYSVPVEEAHRFGVLHLDADGRVVDFQEKPEHPESTWASMGVYCFNREVLVEVLQADAEDKDSTHDFGRDIIPRIFSDHRVFAYQYQDYWRDVGTIDAYWDASMDLLAPRPPLDLDNSQVKLRTAGSTRTPARFGEHATVQRSLISPGARIDGSVKNSIISPGVIVQEGAEVSDSIIFHDSVISAGATVDRVILDKEVSIGPNACVGHGESSVANKLRPDIVSAGISIVGKRAIVPSGLTIGRNVVIGPGTHEELADNGDVASGETILPKKMPLHLFV